MHISNITYRYTIVIELHEAWAKFCQSIHNRVYYNIIQFMRCLKLLTGVGKVQGFLLVVLPAPSGNAYIFKFFMLLGAFLRDLVNFVNIV